MYNVMKRLASARYHEARYGERGDCTNCAYFEGLHDGIAETIFEMTGHHPIVSFYDDYVQVLHNHAEYKFSNDDLL